MRTSRSPFICWALALLVARSFTACEGGGGSRSDAGDAATDGGASEISFVLPGSDASGPEADSGIEVAASDALSASDTDESADAGPDQVIAADTELDLPAPPPADQSEIVSAIFPDSMNCGETTGVNTCPIPDGEAVLASAIILDSPPDVPSWPIATKITTLNLGSDGVAIEFDKKDGPDKWPDVTPPGWDGPLQYTLWLAMSIDGQWYASGIIQFWYGLAASGGDVTKDDQIAKNWVYDDRWGPMKGHQPAPGEYVGFMVVAGNCRGVLDGSQSPVKERSQMVIIPFPAESDAVFSF